MHVYNSMKHAYVQNKYVYLFYYISQTMCVDTYSVYHRVNMYALMILEHCLYILLVCFGSDNILIIVGTED